MHTNRLIHEKSPYLLQHAHNPVDWHGWGEAAFRKAREEDKPVFLSIGYSSCHWCHVMERESFHNEEVAQVLNRDFVPIKVDREERPDVDRIYMTFVQAATGSGGWPLSVWLTPDLKPFFGGTYFPPDGQYGRLGFRHVLERIAGAWQSDREAILESGSRVLEQLRGATEVLPGRAGLDDSVLDAGFNAFRRSFDVTYGGFGEAPKFPRPCTLNFLLRYWERSGKEDALEVALATLKAMARGGIRDQLGGGFHRYSVDQRWFLPHFEKVLCDQAQLAVSYLEAFQITGDGLYAGIARQILDYVLRDMTDPKGAFHSAEDADSAIDPAQAEVHGEGAFYLWKQVQIECLLGQPVAEWFCYHYGVEKQGNVPHGEFAGKNILHEAHSVEETAARFERSPEQVRDSLAACRQKLHEERCGRLRPHRDDKVLSSWNGLMISAFAKAAQVLEDARYLAAARRAAEFLRTHLYRQSEASLLLRRYRDGEAAIPGFLDDYAFFAQGLLDLYQADFDLRDLQLAVELTEKQLQLFEDKDNGAFFSTSAAASDLVLRLKEDYDGAEPSGNSITVLNLLRLSQITGRKDFRAAADRTLQAFATRLRATPEALPQMLVALVYSRSGIRQIVLVGQKQNGKTLAFLQALNQRFLPHTVVLLVDGDAARRTLAGYLPAIQTTSEVDGAPTAYVCENFTCRLPTTELERLLDSLGHRTATMG